MELAENFGFDVIDANFPPDPAPIDDDHDGLKCDLTSFDPPTSLPANILQEYRLKVLKLFIDNLDWVPDGIGNLVNLETLVLCHHESHIDIHHKCTKLPQTLSHLRNLKSIDLRNNPLSKLPPQLLSLSNLQELYVNNCALSALPDNLKQLKLLKVLELSSNSFKKIPVCVTKLENLCRLYMDNVGLWTIPECIKDLKNLERLQLANNQIRSIPDGIYQLIHLKRMRLTNNQITTISDKIGDLVSLEYLFLSQNKLTRLPESIGNLKELRYLNLYENMLTCLPESITDLSKVETILVDSNPLQVPPVDVCNQGTSSIASYFTAMRNTGMIHSKRLKVVLLGESMAGKTSLVTALVKGEACHINEDDRTFGVVFYQWKPQPEVDNLELLVVDCAGQRKYQMTHRLFLSEGSLFILTVNLQRYKSDNPEYFHECVGQWVALVAARIPKARILIVPTHMDRCSSPEDINFKCENIVQCVIEEQEEMLQRIDKKVEYIRRTLGACIPEEDRNKLVVEQEKRKNDLPVISLHYNKQSSVVKDEEQEQVNQHGMLVIPVSNVGQLQGMMDLRTELVRIARNRNLIPTVDIELPASWVTLESTIKDLQKDMKIPCVSIEELQVLLKKRKVAVAETDLDSCLSYLHGIGKLLYFKDIPGLVGKVVLNPCWFASILKQVFRHDLKESLTYNKKYRKLEVHQYQFDQDKEMLFDSGIMTERLLRCIWCDQIQQTDNIFNQLLVMFTHFGLACEMHGHCTSSLDEDESTQSYLMTWFLSNKRPPLEEKWSHSVSSGQVEVTVGYSLLQYLPLGVFERFSVLCHSYEPEDFHHWQNGLYMKFGDVLILGNVSCIQKCSTITLAARAPCLQLTTLWERLLDLLKEIQKLLDEWPGMNYVHFTVCPDCVKLKVDKPYQFTCNWFNARHRNIREAVCKNKTYGKSHKVKREYLFPPDDTSESPPSQDRVLPEEWLDDIAHKLGTQWPTLARQLGLGTKVGSIKVDNQNNTHEQAVEMLKTWKQKNGRDAKVSVMVGKLRKMEFKDLAEWLEKKC